MSIKVSSTAFFRYLAAQSTTRVSKVRDAKRMMLARPEDFKMQDYWKALREESVRRLMGGTTSQQYKAEIAGVGDRKKVKNYATAAAGLEKWIGRKTITATTVRSQVWSQNGLEVIVAPELLLSWAGSGPYVVKLYFSADRLSKYLANPMLRLLEQTHGNLGTAAILETQTAKLHTGPTARPADLDLLLATEAASFVRIWRAV